MTYKTPYFADVAALIGDPARANIIAALMDGRARTAKELALEAGVSPQTTSGHLAKLADGNLLKFEAQGRHRYYRISDPLVACAVEALMALSTPRPQRHRLPMRADAQLRAARTCYDHLAGHLGVGILDHLAARGYLLRPDAADFHVTGDGHSFFAELGIDVHAVARQRRGFARPCLDWSERRPHLAGGLGAAIADRCLELGWIERRSGTRALLVTPAGADAFFRHFGIGDNRGDGSLSPAACL